MYQMFLFLKIQLSAVGHKGQTSKKKLLDLISFSLANDLTLNHIQ